MNTDGVWTIITMSDEERQARAQVPREYLITQYVIPEFMDKVEDEVEDEVIRKQATIVDGDALCLISYEPIDYGDEFRMCSNPVVPHRYLNEMWVSWKNRSRNDRCAMCKNFNVSHVIYTRI